MSARRGWLPALLAATATAATAMASVAWAAGATTLHPARRGPDEIRTLANGLTVAVLHDDRQPLVQIQLLVPAGSVAEQAGESGLANLTFRMIGNGTASRTGEMFNQAVQALGGTVGGAASREFATINGTFLAGDMEAGLELLCDAVMNPLFSEELLQGAKAQAAGALAGARGNPATLADDHLWAAVFRDHPYGRPALGGPLALNSLRVAQVQAFHRRNYRPDRALLAIAGDITPERAFKAAEQQLGAWGGRAPGPVADSLPAPRGFRVQIVDVPQVARAEFRLGAIGAARADDDYEALAVAAELLSAGPEPGLRASESGLRQAGMFSIGWSAPVDSASQSVARVRAALARAAKEPASNAALTAARTRLVGVNTIQFDTRGGRIAQWMSSALNPRRGDSTADLPARVSGLSADQVSTALARRMAPERTVLVVVGPASRLRSRLEGLGTVEVVPAETVAEILESPSNARGPVTPAQGIRGRALVSQAVTAHGGLERLRAVKDSRIEGDMAMAPRGGRELTGKMVQVRKDPERFRFETMFSVLKSLQVLDGERGAWSRTGDPPAPVGDLDSVSIAGLRSGFHSDVVHLLLSASDPATRVAWRGQERRDDHDADVIELVTQDGERRLLFLDATSHRLIATEQNDGGRSAQRIYRDLRDAGGVLWPYYEERYLDGQRAVTVTLSKVSINTGVDDMAFVRPGSPTSPTSTPQRPRAR